MYHGRAYDSGPDHSHGHEYPHRAELEHDGLNHLIAYFPCEYHEVTGEWVDDARDEVYTEVGYECDRTKTVYITLGDFYEDIENGNDENNPITYDNAPDVYEEMCGEAYESLARDWFEPDEYKEEAVVCFEYGDTPYYTYVTDRSSEV